MTIDQKYLINPFIKEVSSKGFINRKHTMNIIRGTTGSGKTYGHTILLYHIVLNKD